MQGTQRCSLWQPRGMGWGGRFKREMIYVYLWLLHVSVWQKLSQYCKVQFSSVAQSCPTLCDPMDCSTPGLPVHHNSWSLLKLMSIESVMPSNHLILCCPLLLLPSIFPGIRVFSNESVLHIRWPKYWNFSFSISLSNFLGWTGWISLQFKGLAKVCSNTTVQKHQFFGAQLSL